MKQPPDSLRSFSPEGEVSSFGRPRGTTTEAHNTTAGGKLLPCDMDDACSILDCDAVMEDYADALLASPEGEEFVTHYCGVRFLQRPADDQGHDG